MIVWFSEYFVDSDRELSSEQVEMIEILNNRKCKANQYTGSGSSNEEVSDGSIAVTLDVEPIIPGAAAGANNYGKSHYCVSD